MRAGVPVLWLRLLGLVFGVTTYAASTVWASFMTGLAVGNLIAGRSRSAVLREHQLRSALATERRCPSQRRSQPSAAHAAQVRRVTADIIHPIYARSGNLYSVEYFRLLRQVLKPGGIAVQWVTGTEPEYKLIARTFLSATGAQDIGTLSFLVPEE